MIRNIIFDWSGTLVDDLPAVWKATNYVLSQSGKGELTLDQFRAEFCLPFTIFYDRHVPEADFPQLEEWFHFRFRQVQDSVCELPHARRFLEFCRDRKIRTFLLSTVHHEHFAVQAGVTGFEQFLEKPYVNVWDKREKIRDILQENGLMPEETMFIGDMEHDMETAHHGGVQAVAVLTGYNTLSQLRRSTPDLVVEHLGELQIILSRDGMAPNPPEVAESESRTPVSTVGGLIFDDQGRVLMVRTHKWSDLWGIPGGKIKWGEAAVAALLREIREETALDVDEVRLVLVQDCIGSKEFYKDAHFVLLNYTCRVRGMTNVVLNEEAREYRWVTPADALALPLNHPTRTLLLATGEKSP